MYVDAYLEVSALQVFFDVWDEVLDVFDDFLLEDHDVGWLDVEEDVAEGMSATYFILCDLKTYE